MRDYATVRPEFWTRGTGKRIRGNPVAQVLACYLMTSPHTSMTGIFHAAIPIVVHETGLTEAQVREALAILAKEDFAHYDDESELVFLPSGARTQIGDTLKPTDHKHKAVWREISSLGDHPFAMAFAERYGEAYQAPCKPLASPLQAPSKGGAEGLRACDARVPDPVPDPVPDQEGVQGEGLDAEPDRLDGIRDDGRETPCPLDLADRWTGADAMAESLKVPRAAVDAVVEEFVAYWTIGGGAGKRRAHWARKLREEVRQKLRDGTVASKPARSTGLEDTEQW